MKKRFFGVVMAAGLLVVVLLAALQAPAAAVGEPPLTTNAKQITHTLYPATALSGGATAYSTAPSNLDAFSRDRSALSGWNAADVFVVADVTGTAYLTATVQFSPDGTNWADGDYEYATDSAIATKAYVRSLSADGVEYMRVPLAGEYMRLKLQSAGTVTPTVKVTYRN